MTITKIREYAEGMGVEIEQRTYMDQKRWVVIAYNEGGFKTTAVDLVDLFEYVKENMSEVWLYGK